VLENISPTLLDNSGRAALAAAIGNLTLGGEHALYDATNDAVSQLRRLADPSRINAVVVLTDGGDTSSSLQEPTLLTKLRAAREPGQPAVVYTIAYGADADRLALEQIAVAAQGNEFTAGPGQLESTYRTIASYL
jgi:Ca-activated chloride channel homolog